MDSHGARTTAADARQILDNIRRLVRVLRETASAAERGAGISAAQLFVLQTLIRPMTVNELAEATLTHQSSVSVVARKLVERGLVRRSSVTGDRRRVLLSLTREGEQIRTRVPPAAQQKLIAALRQMSANQRRQLAHSLEALVTRVTGGQTTAPLFFEDTPRAARPRQRLKPT